MAKEQSLSYKNIIDNIRNGNYSPVYLLHGEEPYYIDLIANCIENNVLNESERDFNQTIVYGHEVSETDIINMAKRYPMMSEYQVIIVREAQKLSKIENLEPYISHSLSSTILVLCHKYKKVDGRTKFASIVKDKGVLFESVRLYDDKLPAFITDLCQQKHCTITPESALLMAEFLGNDLEKIQNEIDKLLLNIKQGSTITPDEIERYIGISKEFNVFELQKAIGQKDILKAHKIINYFGANPKDNPMPKIAPMIYSYLIKVLIYNQLQDKSQAAKALGVNPFFVKDYQIAAKNYTQDRLINAISWLREADAKSKGIDNYSITDEFLLKEFICKLMY